MSALPALPPPHNLETAPFWAAAAESRLVLPRCNECATVIWYPRSWCPACGHGAITWTEMSGRGHVYAVTVLRRGMGPWADAAPFVVAYVELEEGPRLLANVQAAVPGEVRIGDPLQAIFAPLPGQPEDTPVQTVLRFVPR